ncbi:hypothetical protein SDC9_155367 [bioreactor metagenome]|uniref:Uncharacterized protein n=1 Tax=bioreactor metagenome TaxID=1076179 RepID=A0A645F2P2_9ZZZZ
MTLIFLVWIYVVYTFGIDISHRYLFLVILLVIIFILSTYFRFYIKSRDFNLFAEVRNIINKLGKEKSKSQTGFYPLIFWFHLIFMTLIFLMWIFVVYTFEIDKSHENLLFIILFIVILYISIIAYLLLLKRCFEALFYFEHKDLLDNERDKWFYIYKENIEGWETAQITRET